MREALRRELAGAPDFLRALSRLSLDRGGPRDLAAVRDGACRGGGARAHCSRLLTICRPSSSRAYARLRADCGALGRDLEATLADDLPLVKRDGGFVRAGASPALDEARALRDESRRVIAELQASYAERDRRHGSSRSSTTTFSAITSRRRRRQGETLLKAPLNATFIHRQTMAGAMRFTTNALIELEAKHRLRRRPGAGARARRLRAPAPGLPRRGRGACAASARRWPRSTSPRRSRNLRSSATGPGRWSTLRSPSGSRAAAIRWSRRR